MAPRQRRSRAACLALAERLATRSGNSGVANLVERARDNSVAAASSTRVALPEAETLAAAGATSVVVAATSVAVAAAADSEAVLAAAAVVVSEEEPAVAAAEAVVAAASAAVPASGSAQFATEPEPTELN